MQKKINKILKNITLVRETCRFIDTHSRFSIEMKNFRFPSSWYIKQKNSTKTLFQELPRIWKSEKKIDRTAKTMPVEYKKHITTPTRNFTRVTRQSS